MYFQVAGIIPSILTTSLLGPYSDAIGRKFILLIPVIGGLLKAVISMLVALLHLPFQILIAAFFIEGLAGGSPLILTGLVAYSADTTSSKHRSMALFLLDLSFGLATCGSNIGFGFMIKATGYSYSFILVLGLYFLNMLFIILVVKETKKHHSADAKLFTTEHLKKSITVYATKEATNRRWKLIMLLLIMCSTSTGEVQNSDVMTYHLLDEPLCFTSVFVGFYIGAIYLVRALGGILILKCLHWLFNDLGLLFLGCLSCATFQILLPFLLTKEAVFIGKFQAQLHLTWEK